LNPYLFLLSSYSDWKSWSGIEGSGNFSRCILRYLWDSSFSSSFQEEKDPILLIIFSFEKEREEEEEINSRQWRLGMIEKKMNFQKKESKPEELFWKIILWNSELRRETWKMSERGRKKRIEIWISSGRFCIFLNFLGKRGFLKSFDLIVEFL
jgi:hypothetical protein